MAVNRYDNPAQAQFIDTYVPIPFEQLYTLGKQAQDNVNQALKDYSEALDKWADFTSPSQVDTQAWYNETYGRALPVAEEMAKNMDLIRTPEGRARIYSVINNVDRAKLSMLRQSAANLRARQEANQRLMALGLYNPEWHDLDFANYNTQTSGIFNDVSPLPYQSEVDMVKPFVDNLKDSFLGSRGGYLFTGVTQDQVRHQIDLNMSSILNTPQARRHLEVLVNRGLTPDQALTTLRNSLYTAGDEFVRENVSGVDAFALENLRQANRLRLKGAGQQQGQIPDTYSRVYYDTARKEADQLYSNPIFTNSRELRLESNRRALELQNQLESGVITQEQYNSEIQSLAQSEQGKGKEYQKAYQDDMRNLFFSLTNIAPNVGVAKDATGTYVDGANRVLNEITYNIPGQIVNAYNKSKSTAEVELQDGNVPVTGYVSPTSKGMMLDVDYVNKLMGVAPAEVKYMVEDNRGLRRNFAEDLRNGVFKNIIRIPQSTGMTSNVNGDNAIVQRVRIKIPKTSIEAAGYDIDSFDERVLRPRNMTQGGRFLGLGTRNVANVDENLNIKTQDGQQSLTDTYYTFDVMEVMDPSGSERLMWDQEANDLYGGSKMQNDQYNQSFIDSYDDILNALSY